MFKVLLIIFTTILSASPNWYLNNNSTFLIGYGQDSSLIKARDLARIDLSQIITSDVSSENKIYQSYSKYTSTSKQKITSQNRISGSEIYKEIYKNGMWYVAIKYDNRSTVNKLAEKVKLEKNIILDETQTTALSKTKFQKKLNSILKLNVSSDLYVKNNSYYFRASNSHILLSQDDLKYLFETQQNDNKLILNKTIYKDKDFVTMRVKSDYKYYTIFAVDYLGKVCVVYKNEIVNNFGIRPNKRTDSYSINVISIKNEVLIEMYVSIFSDEKIDTQEFESMDYVELDNSNLKLYELFQLMDKYTYSSFQVKIKN